MICTQIIKLIFFLESTYLILKLQQKETLVTYTYISVCTWNFSTFKIRIVVVRYILQFTDICDYLSASFCYLVFQISFFLHKNQTVFTALWGISLVQHCIERHFNISYEKGDRNVRYLVAGMQETEKALLECQSSSIKWSMYFFISCIVAFKHVILELDSLILLLVKLKNA